MKRQIRVVLGITLLILSIALLIWGFLPARREVRTQPISPTDLQLPTPASFNIPSTVIASHEVAKQSHMSLMKIEYEALAPGASAGVASSGRFARRYRVSTPPRNDRI